MRAEQYPFDAIRIVNKKTFVIQTSFLNYFQFAWMPETFKKYQLFFAKADLAKKPYFVSM